MRAALLRAMNTVLRAGDHPACYRAASVKTTAGSKIRDSRRDFRRCGVQHQELPSGTTPEATARKIITQQLIGHHVLIYRGGWAARSRNGLAPSSGISGDGSSGDNAQMGTA